MVFFIKLLRQAQFHGAIRLADGKYRLAWAGALLLLLAMAVQVVCLTVWRYFDNPTFLVQVASLQTHIPFPSVLVFPEIHFPKNKMDDFVAEINIPSDVNASLLRKVLYQLESFWAPDVVYSTKYLELIERVLDHNQMDIVTAGRRLTTSCEETLIKCRWEGQNVNCSSLFQMELSPYGYCCVFNGRSLNREMAEYGVHKVKPGPPWLTKDVGPTTGLMVAVNQSQEKGSVDLSYKWEDNDGTFQLALQTGQHYVESTVNGTALSPAMEQWAGFVTLGFQIAEDARGLSDSLRQCRMSYEPLKYFPIYNRQYCLLECEMIRTLQRCQCVSVVHPRPPGARRCRARKMRCARHAAVPIASDQCHCPNACDIDMDYVILQGYDLTDQSYTPDDFYDKLNFSEVTIVRSYVMTHYSKVFARKSYYDSLNLFSQLGGVFNVFFGCSILTLLELIQLAYQSLKRRW